MLIKSTIQGSVFREIFQMFTIKADTDVERSFPVTDFQHSVIVVIRNLVHKGTARVVSLALSYNGQKDFQGLHKVHFSQKQRCFFSLRPITLLEM